jgi:heterodisulfide reductase subunit C
MATNSFKREIEVLSGQNINLCFQCSKCSSGCPLAYRMDIMPAQVVHSIRLGRETEVLSSNSIWLCAGCETCTARCPQGLEPAALMSAARILAAEKGIPPKVPEVAVFYQSFIENMMAFGRISDLMLVVALKLKNEDLFSDLPLAVKFFERGKLNPLKLPSGGREFRRIFERVNEVREEPM